MMAIFTVPSSLCHSHWAILTVPLSLGQHLEGKVAWRVDPQHLEGNLPQAAPGDLVGRPGEEDPGELDCLLVAGELDAHRSVEADVPVAAGGEPVGVVRPDDGDAAARLAHALHLGQAGLAAVPRGGREGRAGDDQVGETVREGQLVEEPVDHPSPVAVIRCPELPPQDLAQGPRGLYRYHLPATLEEFERQPSRTRADLGDPVYAMRQPAQYIRMEPLDAGQPVIELRFEPVKQLPG